MTDQQYWAHPMYEGVFEVRKAHDEEERKMLSHKWGVNLEPAQHGGGYIVSAEDREKLNARDLFPPIAGDATPTYGDYGDREVYKVSPSNLRVGKPKGYKPEKKVEASVKPKKEKHAVGYYLGPEGGKWSDPEHTIPWKESTASGGGGGGHPNPEFAPRSDRQKEQHADIKGKHGVDILFNPRGSTEVSGEDGEKLKKLGYHHIGSPMSTGNYSISVGILSKWTSPSAPKAEGQESKVTPTLSPGSVRAGAMLGSNWKVKSATAKTITIVSAGGGNDPGARFSGKSYTFRYDGTGFKRQGEYLMRDGSTKDVSKFGKSIFYKGARRNMQTNKAMASSAGGMMKPAASRGTKGGGKAGGAYPSQSHAQQQFPTSGEGKATHEEKQATRGAVSRMVHGAAQKVGQALKPAAKSNGIICPHCECGISKGYAVKSLAMLAKSEGYDLGDELESLALEGFEEAGLTEEEFREELEAEKAVSGATNYVGNKVASHKGNAPGKGPHVGRYRAGGQQCVDRRGKPTNPVNEHGMSKSLSLPIVEGDAQLVNYGFGEDAFVSKSIEGGNLHTPVARNLRAEVEWATGESTPE